jgi:hypothetical protein
MAARVDPLHANAKHQALRCLMAKAHGLTRKCCAESVNGSCCTRTLAAVAGETVRVGPAAAIDPERALARGQDGPGFWQSPLESFKSTTKSAGTCTQTHRHCCPTGSCFKGDI